MEEENNVYQLSLVFMMLLCFIIPMVTLFVGFKVFPANSILPPILCVSVLFLFLIGMCVFVMLHDQPKKKIKDGDKKDTGKVVSKKKD